MRRTEDALNIIISECEGSRKEALRKPSDQFELGKAYAYSIIAIYCYQVIAEMKKEKDTDPRAERAENGGA